MKRGTVGGIASEVVDGRKLWRKLESGNDLSTWFKKRVDQYNFFENQDFALLHETVEQKTGRGGHNAKDYSLTLDMAKGLSWKGLPR